MSTPARFLALAAVAAIAAVVPSAGAAGGVLPSGTSPDPSTLDVQIAVARSPGGGAGVTRWSRITVAGAPSVMWLVPARPGAALDYANDAWLDALDQVTAPRVRPPSYPPPCEMSSQAERVPTWGTLAAKRYPKGVTVLETEVDARAHAAAKNYRVSAEAASRINDAYARGWRFVALEIETPGGVAATSPTVRVSDDGGLGSAATTGVVPLALTGSTTVTSRVVAMVVGEGAADLPGARDLDRTQVVWKKTGSSYTSERAALLTAGAGATWLRESATHDGLFAEQPVPLGDPVLSLVSAYFRGATGQTRATCENAAISASIGSGAVGRVCPAGALATVPGGASCAPTVGAVDPQSFVCGASVDDLALALAGVSPRSAVVTRFAGIVPVTAHGSDLTIGSSPSLLDPLQPAARFDACPVSTPPSGGVSTPPPPVATTRPDEDDGTYTRTVDGCTGTSTVLVYEDTGEEQAVADEGCGASSTGTSTSTGDDGESCGGDTTGSSSGSSSDTTDKDSSEKRSDDSNDESWDTADDEDDDTKSSTDDGCSKKSSSSSTSSSSSSGADGWDDEDMAPKSFGVAPTSTSKEPKAPGAKKRHVPKKKPVTAASTTRARSPVSRYALLLVALILPLRRRLRSAKRIW